MKLTTALILFFCLHVSASVFSQQVTLKEKNASLETVLKSIRKQTGYTLLYSDEVLKGAPKVSVNLDHASVTQALDAVLQGQPLTYTIDQHSIFIKRKSVAANVPAQAAAPIDVSGRITDEHDQPLAGATVKTKDNKHATTSDANGFFILKDVEAGSTLVVSFIGYDNHEISAAANVGQIKLNTATSKLDEVKVIAYGQTTQRLSTGDISAVSSREISQQPTADPLLALQGRVPGLFVQQSNGFAGSGVNVQILGQNSIRNGNMPLFVVDGVPNFSQLLPTSAGILGSPSPYALLDPSDIESISILKDADATSIYGSRAANGAILITTKKGKVGKTIVDFNLQNGWGHVAKHEDMMGTQQYLALRREALKNDGISTPGTTDYDLNGTWDPNAYTDWQKTLIGNTAHYMDLQATVSGGNANTQFLVGVGDHRETTVLAGSFPDQKTSLHLNLNNISDNQRFKLQFNANYLLDNNNVPYNDPTANALTLPPNAPSLFNSDGTLNWALDGSGNTTWTNGYPALFAVSKTIIKTNNLTANSILSYQILPGLSIKSSFGYTYQQVSGTNTFPLVATAPARRNPNRAAGIYNNNNQNSWLIEPQLTYDHVFGKGKLQGILGGTLNQQNSMGVQQRATGFSSDLLLNNVAAATTVTSAVNGAIYKYNAAFGRVNYNWDDKYIVNLTARRDGSSRFGPENRFHDFWSVGAAWIFSQELWLDKETSILSFGKLSASYGTTGNDQIGDYVYQNNYNAVSYALPYLNGSSLASGGLPNPYLQWEQTNKTRLGIDLGFFKDRLLISADFIRSVSSNQLLPYTLPITTGSSQILENFPATVENKVWEFSLTSRNLDGNLKWYTTFNLTIPKNRLTAFPNLATSSYSTQLFIGQPVSIARTAELVGVDPQTGIYQFRTANGGLSSVPVIPDDLNGLVNVDPKLYGGLGNTFTYKGFSLDIFLQFTRRTANDYFEKYGLLPGFMYNQPADLSRWQNPGDIAQVQKANSNGALLLPAIYAETFANNAFVDASYIRLKTVSLSWTLPRQWYKPIRAQNLRVYTQAQNLLTFTGYKGLDPETPLFGTLPPLRVITFGVQASF